MYEISEAFSEALTRPVKHYRIRGEVQIGSTSYEFTELNIEKRSLSISNQCSDDDNVGIGQVYMAECSLTFVNNFNLPKRSLKDAKIIPNLQMLTENGYENVPLGVFNIAEANWATWGIEITAYDNMSLLDKPIALDSASGYISDFIIYACTECGVSLGMTEAELRALPNGTEYVTLYLENDLETYRDLISWCAATMASFATMDRSGSLVFRCYGQISVDTLNGMDRINGALFSDFETRYTSLTVDDINKETTDYYALAIDDGLTYHLGSNPFLQNSTSRERMAQNILNALALIDYVPFETSLASALVVYDLGDVLTFTGGAADETKMYCITQYEWQYGEEYYAKGVGQNPALANARGKTDKEITGVANRSGKGSSDFEIITNLREVAVENRRRRRVLHASIMTVEDAKVKMDAEILLTVAPVQQGTEIICSVTYQLDSQILTRNPVETWSIGGQHILRLMYALAISKSGFHNFDIYLEVSGGNIAIEPYEIQATFSGLGIVVDPGWSGQLELVDDAPVFELEELEFDITAYSESVSTSIIVPDRIILTDAAPVFELEELEFDGSDYVDSVSFKPYISELLWREAAASTWGTLKESYVWGHTGG